MQCFGQTDVSFFYLTEQSQLIAASHMIIDIFIFPLLFCRYIEYYIGMLGYALCQHKCR